MSGPLAINSDAPDFEAQTTEGPIQLSRVAGQFLGRDLFASQGLHAGVHDRARLHGAHQARVRQAQREDHRPQRRSGRSARRLGEGHRGDAGHRAELSR